MKIGIVGPKTTVDIIREIVKKDLFDIKLVCRISDFYKAAPTLVQELQEKVEVDAILFTGPTNYGYAKKRIKPTVPWGHLLHNRSSLQEALLKAMTICNNNLKAISVDRYDKNLVEEVLLGIGIKDFNILNANIDYEEDDFEKKLLEFHKSNYLNKHATICLTSMENITAPLTRQKIPCIRIFPSKETVIEQIYYLRMMHTARRENKGLFAAILISFEYIFENTKEISAREWEKMKYQNECREMIYAVAKLLDAAVFEDGADKFYIITSKTLMLNKYIKGGIHQSVLSFATRRKQHKTCIGMGVGSTMVEAKAKAIMTFNNVLINNEANTCLLEDKESASVILNETTQLIEGPETDIFYFSKKLKISRETLIKLSDVIKQCGDTLTSEEIAKHMGITNRSVNRIMLCLEDEGFVTVVGKKSSGKGRPARLLKILLPHF